jgi:hypothetical protein
VDETIFRLYLKTTLLYRSNRSGYVINREASLLISDATGGPKTGSSKSLYPLFGKNQNLAKGRV